VKHEIKHINGTVLYVAEIDDATPSGLRTRAALENATRERAYLRGADLGGADLRGAYLGGGKDAPKLVLVGQRPILSIGPIGSRSDYLLAFLTDEGVHVRAGCFFGALEEFRAAVQETHAGNDHGREYAAAIVMIKAHAAIWMPSEVAA
jgi:hypothetical protein